MPLRDHFRPPLRREINWHSFHNAWATTIAYQLNPFLPDDYRAVPNLQTSIEIDVAAFRTHVGPTAPAGPAAPAWEPAGSVQTIPFELAAEAVEVLVYRELDGAVLSGAIELVSEANKNRPAHREAFVSKCLGYLRNGVGLVVFDAVTVRAANLHDELMARLRGLEAEEWGASLYVTAYRPTGKNGDAQLGIWREELALGRPLPTAPLWLLNGPCVPVELESTYEETYLRLRLPPDLS